MTTSQDPSSSSSGAAPTLLQPPTLYLPNPSPFLPPPRILSAAHDLLPTFGLLPIYNEAVKPYIKQRPPPLPPGVAAAAPLPGKASVPQQAQKAGDQGALTSGSPASAAAEASGAGSAAKLPNAGPSGSTPRLASGNQQLAGASPALPGRTGPGASPSQLSSIGMNTGVAYPSPRNFPGSGAAAVLSASNSAQMRNNPSGTNTAEPPRPPRTWAHFVEDLPGKVRPTKAELRGTRSSGKADHSMRDVIFKPETTIHRIVPFEEETLRNFILEPGRGGDGIDLKRLESDDEEEQVQKRKKRKKEKKSGADDGAPAKRQKR